MSIADICLYQVPRCLLLVFLCQFQAPSFLLWATECRRTTELHELVAVTLVGFALGRPHEVR